MTYKPVSKNYRSRSRSRSITPPHWKNNKTITLSEYEKRKKDKERREKESNRRAELRRERHEHQAAEEKKRIAREEEYSRKRDEEHKKKGIPFESRNDYISKNDNRHHNSRHLQHLQSLYWLKSSEI